MTPCRQRCSDWVALGEPSTSRFTRERTRNPRRQFRRFLAGAASPVAFRLTRCHDKVYRSRHCTVLNSALCIACTLSGARRPNYGTAAIFEFDVGHVLLLQYGGGTDSSLCATVTAIITQHLHPSTFICNFGLCCCNPRCLIVFARAHTRHGHLGSRCLNCTAPKEAYVDRTYRHGTRARSLRS